jgi:hypothetical protein
MTPRRRSEIYRLAVAVIAMAVFLANLKRLAAGGFPDPPLVAALTVADLVALQFPLHVSLNEKVSVAAAVFFGAALLMPVWQAAALVAATQGAERCAVGRAKSWGRHAVEPAGRGSRGGCVGWQACD